MSLIYVTPAEGARVRMPDRGSTVMPEAGAWVPRTVHYEHLLECGDVVLANPQPARPDLEAPAIASPQVSPETRSENPASRGSRAPSKEK